MNEERTTLIDEESSCSSSPDTDVSAPLTPPSDHISVDVGPFTSQTRELSTAPPPPTPSTGVDLRETQKSKFQPSTKAESPIATKAPAQNGHTTLQSMKKPELVPGAVPHSRRFLSIEHELSELSVALKVMEKRVQRAEKKLLWIGLIAASTVLIAALLALL